MPRIALLLVTAAAALAAVPATASASAIPARCPQSAVDAAVEDGRVAYRAHDLAGFPTRDTAGKCYRRAFGFGWYFESGWSGEATLLVDLYRNERTGRLDYRGRAHVRGLSARTALAR